MMTEIIFYALLACFAAFIIAIVMGIKKRCDNQEEFLLNRIVELSTSIMELQEEVKTLGTNTESPKLKEIEHEDGLAKAIEKMNREYNEGLDSIFGYSVNTGIKVGEKNE